ncbi:MAG: SPOR domain-containing protein [SAR324 cluster bacterium]|nr:SPOR domain-containing protein [SAR324 cluster bacterium]
MASENKRRIPSVLLWGGIGVLILLLGAGSALFYFSRSQGDLGGFSLSTFSLPFFTKEEPTAPELEKPEARTYTVQEGDNLWAIAKKGELVDSPWQWRDIVVQNKDKIDYAFVSQETGDWKVLVAKGQTLSVTPEPPPDPDAPVKKKFALQLLATPEPNLNRALNIVKLLLSDGYYAYLYRIEVKGQQVYRIRVGFFETKKLAEEAGKQIHSRYAKKKIFPDEFMVFLPSFREMRGERLDFGVQKSRPRVIEFPHRETHARALEDLKAVSPASEFAYISQRKDPLSGLFLYRTRVGFFATAELAKQLILTQGENGEKLWHRARVTSLKTFKESLPGQRIKVAEPPRS